MRAGQWDRGYCPIEIPVRARPHRRLSGAVVGDDAIGTAGSIEGESVAADAGRLRFDDAEESSRGNGRIRGSAAGSQHFDCRQACEGVRSSRHPIEGMYGRTTWRMEVTHVHLVHEKQLGTGHDAVRWNHAMAINWASLVDGM